MKANSFCILFTEPSGKQFMIPGTLETHMETNVFLHHFHGTLCIVFGYLKNAMETNSFLHHLVLIVPRYLNTPMETNGFCTNGIL